MIGDWFGMVVSLDWQETHQPTRGAARPEESSRSVLRPQQRLVADGSKAHWPRAHEHEAGASTHGYRDRGEMGGDRGEMWRAALGEQVGRSEGD